MAGAAPTIETRRGVDLRRLLDIWYRRRRLVLSLVVLLLVGVEVTNWYVYPSFEATASLLIEAPVGLDVPFSRDKLVFKKSEITQTQSELALRRPNLETVARDLALDRRPQYTPDLRGKAHRFVSGVTDTVRDTLQGAKRFAIQRVFGGQYTPPRRPTRFEEVVAELEQPAAVTVEPVLNTDLIKIVVHDRDPNTAADIANRLVDVYLSSETAMRKQRARDTFEAIEQRLAVLRPELHAARDALAHFKDENRIASIDGQVDSTLKTLSMLELTYWDVCQKESVRTLSTWQAVRQENNNERDMGLRAQTALLAKMSDLAELETLYKPDHAKVVAARAAVDELRRQISAGLASAGVEPNDPPGPDSDALKKALLAKLQNLRDELGRLSRLNTEYQALTWDQEQSGEMVKLLTRKAEDALTAESTTQSQARAVAPAQPSYAPNWPAKWRNRVLALVTALALALAFCALLEYFDTTVRRPEDVTRVLNLPTLGSIPFVS